MRIRILNAFWIAVGISCLASCATVERMPEYTGSDKTCIAGSTVNPIDFFTTDEAHVEIITLNGQLRGGNGEHCYEPGLKVIGIQSMKGYPSTFRGEFPLDAKAGAKYKIRSYHRYGPRSVLVTAKNEMNGEMLRFETGNDGRLHPLP
jgi:hypothetical protein